MCHYIFILHSNSGNIAGIGINHLLFKSSILEQLNDDFVTLLCM